jgi:predicted nucleic acid-binding Zn ribbon protein
MDYSAEVPAAPNKGTCPVCSTNAPDGALFCAACGAFLKAEDGRRPQKRETRGSTANGRPAPTTTTTTAVAPDNIDFGFVQLMGEITLLQRDLLRQFRQGQAIQARQFERALQAQALSLEKTLAHVDSRVQASEERLHIWQRWSAGLGAAVVIALLIITQIL